MKKTSLLSRATASRRVSLSKILFGLTLLLSLLGLFFIFEASSAESYQLVGNQYHFLIQQTISLGLGLVGLAAALLVPIQFWRKTASMWFLVGLGLLILVLIPGVGIALNGAHRWFTIAGQIFQPVEFFKLALILFSATWMAKQPKPQTFLVITALFSLLVILQPDIGSLLVLLWIAFGLFFLAGGSILVLGGLGVAGIVLLLLVIITSPYRFQRLTTYLNPENDLLGTGFHVRQITLALGHGGWFGVGIGNSQQKYAYIPEASSDSIFAIVAEEIGFVGAGAVIAALVAYSFTLYRAAMSLSERSFEQLLVFGIFLWIGGQTLLNLAAVVVLVPLTGLPLPFFSYGGTSLLVTLFATGLVLRILREHKVQ